MTTFSLRLADTYWSKGFFNVSVDFERFLTTTDGPIDIRLGNDATPLIGRITRSANNNATPRIFGNKPLAEFFQKYFKKGDVVAVEIIAPRLIRIGSSVGVGQAITEPPAGPPETRLRSSAPRQRLNVAENPSASLSNVDIHGMYGHVARFCEGLWKSQLKTPMPRDLSSLISSLQRQLVVPTVEAGMMHTIRTVRNSHVHDHRRLGPREIQVVTGAWDVITVWAERQHSSLWRATNDLL